MDVKVDNAFPNQDMRIHLPPPHPLEAEDSARSMEMNGQVHQWKKQNLFLDIPPRKDVPCEDACDTKSDAKEGQLSADPCLLQCEDRSITEFFHSRSKSSIQSLLPRLGSIYRSSSGDIEEGSSTDAFTPWSSGQRQGNIYRNSMPLIIPIK